MREMVETQSGGGVEVESTILCVGYNICSYGYTVGGGLVLHLVLGI